MSDTGTVIDLLLIGLALVGAWLGRARDCPDAWHRIPSLRAERCPSCGSERADSDDEDFYLLYHAARDRGREDDHEDGDADFD